MTTADGSFALLHASPRWADVAARHGLEEADVRAILTEADRVADEVLAPYGAEADREGCRIDGGRVRMPAGSSEAWRHLADGGWLAPDLPAEAGGAGLPTALHAAASLASEGAAMPFLMAAGATRAAAHLLAAAGRSDLTPWVQRLASGAWSATICISEPEAGSDVGRIRTKARHDGAAWRIDGAKCWISFGDHDLTARIGHLVLARTGPPEVGTRGLSLFLVPDTDDAGARNGITVERLERKLGLHGSPTCALRFDGAAATPVGAEGRGLTELFAMIRLMRLQTACQGGGVALRALAVAKDYASTRRQGGPTDAAPVPIGTHPDVRRQILALEGPAEILRAILLETALTLDAARDGDAEAEELAGALLPLVKTFGGEVAQEVAGGAMQVLGGTGYTTDWPLERLLRDARILTIYEGTTGMQAQDFLLRRQIGGAGAAARAILSRALPEVEACDAPEAVAMAGVLRDFGDLSGRIAAGNADLAPPLLAADGYLRAGWIAVNAWMICRLLTAGHAAPAARMAAHLLPARFALAEASCRLPADLLAPDAPQSVTA